MEMLEMSKEAAGGGTLDQSTRMSSSLRASTLRVSKVGTANSGDSLALSS